MSIEKNTKKITIITLLFILVQIFCIVSWYINLRKSNSNKLHNLLSDAIIDSTNYNVYYNF